MTKNIPDYSNSDYWVQSRQIFQFRFSKCQNNLNNSICEKRIIEDKMKWFFAYFRNILLCVRSHNCIWSHHLFRNIPHRSCMDSAGKNWFLKILKTQIVCADKMLLIKSAILIQMSTLRDILKVPIIFQE